MAGTVLLIPIGTVGLELSSDQHLCMPVALVVLRTSIPGLGAFSEQSSSVFRSTGSRPQGTKVTLPWLKSKVLKVSPSHQGQMRYLTCLAQYQYEVTLHILPYKEAPHSLAAEACRDVAPNQLVKVRVERKSLRESRGITYLHAVSPVDEAAYEKQSTAFPYYQITADE